MYPPGQYMQMLSELKDMVRYHHYDQESLLDMSPVEYQATRLMIANDIKRELEAKNG